MYFFKKFKITKFDKLLLLIKKDVKLEIRQGFKNPTLPKYFDPGESLCKITVNYWSNKICL
jgi:hypothetical protein